MVRRRLRAAALTGLALCVAAPVLIAQRQHARLFSPADLGLLEGPDREAWQRPEQIMDALLIGEESVVADLGAGGGWFTIRLANRAVNGRVYAEDIQREMIESIKRRVEREGRKNVSFILGTPTDPRLPEPVDAVLIVDAYHEMSDPEALLRNVSKSLKPAGRLGIVDYTMEGGGPGPPTDERVDPERVIHDAQKAGLRLISRGTFLRYQYLLVFGRGDAAAQ